MCTWAAATAEMPVAQESPSGWSLVAQTRQAGLGCRDTDLTKWKDKNNRKQKRAFPESPAAGRVDCTGWWVFWVFVGLACSRSLTPVSARCRGDRIHEKVVEKPASSTGSSNIRPWLQGCAPDTHRSQQTPPSHTPNLVSDGGPGPDKELDRDTATQ